MSAIGNGTPTFGAFQRRIVHRWPERNELWPGLLRTISNSTPAVEFCRYWQAPMTRLVDAGYLASKCAGRTGRGLKLPPQLGQMWLSRSSTQLAQKVHSKVQINASVESGGKSLSQHSQLGRSSSIVLTTCAIGPTPRGAQTLIRRRRGEQFLAPAMTTGSYIVPRA